MWWGVQETNTDEQKSEREKSKLYGVEEYPQRGGEYIKTNTDKQERKKNNKLYGVEECKPMRWVWERDYFIYICIKSHKEVCLAKYKRYIL